MKFWFWFSSKICHKFWFSFQTGTLCPYVCLFYYANECKLWTCFYQNLILIFIKEMPSQWLNVDFVTSNDIVWISHETIVTWILVLLTLIKEETSLNFFPLFSLNKNNRERENKKTLRVWEKRLSQKFLRNDWTNIISLNKISHSRVFK